MTQPMSVSVSSSRHLSCDARRSGEAKISRRPIGGRVSVIIPARNEEAYIGETLDHVLPADPWEVIVVDGHSTDRTAEIAEAFGVTVVSSLPGRARQLNAGAAIATGEVLLFLHADTRLPPSFHQHIRRVLAQASVSAGAFRLRVDAPHRALRVIETLVNWRSRYLQLPYGDQAIFLRAETFRRVGGFANLPIMEDFDLARRLRRLGRIVVAPASIVTSARRWLECGICRTMLINQACIAGYLLGVSPSRLALWRHQSRHCRNLRTPDHRCRRLDVPSDLIILPELSSVGPHRRRARVRFS